ncbi:MEKHLA domain-containing protein [Calothrix sp. PCC 7507]|uniref:MEKHLA domain-containing protein n=1 Tax=Calothrix sp. PCC 7507 TaxID=99598 RepID=UPI00029F1EE9|nr:MEKHLA domain-containing protein [Calothrix sp. PCC 7507]AFY34670.1 MEKHLA domain protein [Calothrix sp. PCC 7507]
MNNAIAFPWHQQAIILHSQRLLQSFQHWMGRSLLDVSGSPEEVAQTLFAAPFVLVSHGIEADPTQIFSFAEKDIIGIDN